VSPSLFNLMIADLEEEMRRGGWRGVKIKGETIYMLAYADDIVLLAEEEEGMRSTSSAIRNPHRDYQNETIRPTLCILEGN